MYTTPKTEWFCPRLGLVLVGVVTAIVLGSSVLSAQLGAGEQEVEETRSGQAVQSARTGENDPLELARLASLAAQKVESVIAAGVFEEYVQDRHEKQLKLRTKADVRVFYDRGKYHLRYSYHTKLKITTYMDNDGISSVTQLAEWKPDNYVAIYDGTSVYCIEFSRRIRPAGCRIEVYDRHEQLLWGLPWRNPAQFGYEMVHLDSLLLSRGREALSTTALPNNGLRITCTARNSAQVRYEADALPQVGYNIAKLRVFNEGTKEPAITKTALWKKVNDLWYVQRFTEERHFRPGQPDEMRSQSVLRYDTVELNRKIDSKLFTLDCLMIPDRTQTLDRRRP